LARQYSQQVTNIVGHLVGRESGSVLVQNRMVQAADTKFKEALLDAYKLSHAFVHRFNLSSSAQQSLDAKLFQASTIDDLVAYGASVDTMATQYCGAAGIDCDFINNSRIFEFDFQHELYPQLRPIVDGETGGVLSVGHQFHAIVTSSLYQRKRPSPGGDQLNLEIPFGIWANDQGETAPERFMLGRNECNHVIIGDTNTGVHAGTMALQIDGENLPSPAANIIYPDGSKAGPLEYYVKRGGTDYARACELITSPTGRLDFQINTYLVGPAPQNLANQAPTPPPFETRSSTWQAWTGSATDVPESAFTRLARDRTLAAPDWVLVIPDVGSAQRWVFGSTSRRRRSRRSAA